MSPPDEDNNEELLVDLPIKAFDDLVDPWTVTSACFVPHSDESILKNLVFIILPNFDLKIVRFGTQILFVRDCNIYSTAYNLSWCACNLFLYLAP